MIIPTYNAGKDFDFIISQIFAQKLEGDFEVLIIDSGSKDTTLEVARKYPVRIEIIPNIEFTHGGTRNMGARLAESPYLIFMSHDAIPIDHYLFEHLLLQLAGPMVAGVYPRQVPKDDAKPLERFFLQRVYPAEPRRLVEKDLDKLEPGSILFSNVTSAVKREVLLRYPFSDKLIMSEDQEWAKRVIQKGFTIIYDAQSQVMHSHNYGLKDLFRRNFDSAYSLNGIFSYGYLDMLRSGFAYFRDEVAFLWSNGHRTWIPYALAYESIRGMGLVLGKRATLFPHKVRKALSSNSKYWDQVRAELRRNI